MLADMNKEARGLRGQRAKKILRLLAVLSLLAPLLSCATLRNAIQFQTPDIVLQEINITGLGLQGGTLDLVFDVYNPNKYSLRSTRLDVSLQLAGTDFGEALIDKPLDFSPENHSRVLMPVRFAWSGVGAAARALLQSQELPYGLTGAVVLDTPIGERRVGLKSKGSVPLRKLI